LADLTRGDDLSWFRTLPTLRGTVRATQQTFSVYKQGAIRWGTQGTRPTTFSDIGDIICHVPYILLYRFRNICCLHTKLSPSPSTTKLRSCLQRYFKQRNAWDEAAKLIGRGLPMLQIKRAFHCFAGRFLELFILFYKNGIVSGNG